MNPRDDGLRLLECVQFAAEQFLSAANCDAAVPSVLAEIARTAHVDAVTVFQSAPAGDKQAQPTARFHYGEVPAELAECSHHRPVQAHLTIPLKVQGSDWGALCIADATPERQWTDAEQTTFRAIANMLGAAIARQRTESAVLDAKTTLELRVNERTRELTAEVAARQSAHAALAEAQSRLLQASHRAGMAEVATGVLHNVGNVLNSVNVSITLARQKIRDSEVSSLVRVADLLEKHPHDIGAFLTEDPKGKVIPRFLIQIARHLDASCSTIVDELDHCTRNVSHIKEIVSVQQNYASASGLVENVAPEQLVEDALQINMAALERRHVHVVRAYKAVPNLLVDKHKALQILVNLVSNARYALDNSSEPRKELTVAIYNGDGRVKIAVVDNGVGISPDNLTRVFAHGFTTRKDGHGFGLHSGAIAAREMGGLLRASSEGPNCGATFTLELPIPKDKTPL